MYTNYGRNCTRMQACVCLSSLAANLIISFFVTDTPPHLKPSINDSEASMSKQESQRQRKDRTVKELEENLKACVVRKMETVPTVAAFDLRYKDSLPPIQGEVMDENDRTGSDRGNVDGEEDEWVTTSHYDR